MKIGLVGQTSQDRSLNFDAQRTVNLYPVLDQQGKEVSALYGTPGLLLFATADNGPIRESFCSTNGRAFVVSGAGLYEIFSDGAATFLGALLTSSSICYMDENPTQLAVADGTYLYTLTYSTNVFAQVSDGDLPLCNDVTFIDTYFVVSKNNSGQFNISAPNDGTAWDALDFATAESSPDNLLRTINAVGLLWLLGSETTEVWADTGAASFPFAKVSGAKMDVGVLAPATARALDNSLFWVGNNKKGSGIVYRAQGFTPQRISTTPIELLIQSAPTPSTLRAYTYEQDGHLFYIVTGGGMSSTLCYDLTTQQWHERAYLNAGVFEAHLGVCGMTAFGKHLVGSRNDGKIYEMENTFYDDDGAPLAAERVYTHISNENIRQVYRSLEIAMESGVGNQSDPGQDPQITLWISRDGGHTWSGGYTTSFGKVGKYEKRAIFRRLGQAKDLTFKVRITDPVKRVLIGSYLK